MKRGEAFRASLLVVHHVRAQVLAKETLVVGSNEEFPCFGDEVDHWSGKTRWFCALTMLES
jgi:hypothetical protein